MDLINYFKVLSEVILGKRKILLSLISNNNDVGLLTECGFLKKDTNRLCLDFIKIITEQNEEFTDFIKSEKELVLEKLLNN